MRIKMLSNVVASNYGCLSKGAEFGEKTLSKTLMTHLIQTGGAEELRENKMETKPYQNKMERAPVIEKKSTAVTNASLSLPADQASLKKTRKKPKTTIPSQSTRTIR